MTEADRRLDQWLRALKWSLTAIPSPEREDIVEETRGHIAERLESGASLDEVLAGFGPPEAYARRFLDDMEVSQALGSQRSGSLLGVIVRRVHRSAVALFALVALLVLGVASFTAVNVLWMEVEDPVRTGLWTNDRGTFFIGQIDDPAKAVDQLAGPGVWIACILLLLASILLARLVLIGAVRTFARR